MTPTHDQVMEVFKAVMDVRNWLFDTHQELERMVFGKHDVVHLDDSARDILGQTAQDALKMAERLSSMDMMLWWHSHPPEQIGEGLRDEGVPEPNNEG